jgi:hypothetical protein
MKYELFANLSEDERVEETRKLKTLVGNSLPDGFEEVESSGGWDFVVPHEVYPDGYHCDPSKPLPFISITSARKHISLNHMGLYASRDLTDWFVKEHQKQLGKKPDMGKGCIRIKKIDDKLIDLIKELTGKMSVEEWVGLYQSNISGK